MNPLRFAGWALLVGAALAFLTDIPITLMRALRLMNAATTELSGSPFRLTLATVRGADTKQPSTTSVRNPAVARAC